MKAKVYNLRGIETGEIELPEDIFNIAVKPEVVHEVFIAQMNNQRESWADTKNRGEVAGGGKKPWAQKALVALVMVRFARRFGKVAALPLVPYRSVIIKLKSTKKPAVSRLKCVCRTKPKVERSGLLKILTLLNKKPN